MKSGLDDLMLVIDWLASQKTPPVVIAAAFSRLHHRVQRGIPIDAPVGDTHHSLVDTNYEEGKPKDAA